MLQFYLNEVIGINEKENTETVNIYTYGNKIYISGKVNIACPVTITDITGRLAGSYKIKTGPVTEINTDGLSGVYLVSVVTEHGIITKKILCNISQ